MLESCIMMFIAMHFCVVASGDIDDVVVKSIVPASVVRLSLPTDASLIFWLDNMVIFDCEC